MKNKEKGIYLVSWLMIISMFVAGAIASMSLADIVGLEEEIREESLPVVASRITAATYALSAVDNSTAELHFNAHYEVTESVDSIQVGFDDEEIELNDFTGVLYLEEGGSSDVWCLETDDDFVVLSPGECL